MRWLSRFGLAGAAVFAAAIISRVSAWLSGPADFRDQAPCAGDVVGPRGDGGRHPSSATLLQFPIRGQALIVELANGLRRRLYGRDMCEGQLLLTLSSPPHTRLRIDAAAYVEFVAASGRYRLVLEMAPDSSLILETTQFDTVTEFVVQYVNSTLAARPSVGLAS